MTAQPVARSGRSRYPQLADGEWLRRRYVEEHVGPVRIAREVGCTGRAVFCALARHGIPVRGEAGRVSQLDAYSDAQVAAAFRAAPNLDVLAEQWGVDKGTARMRVIRAGVDARAERRALTPPLHVTHPILGDPGRLADLYDRHTAEIIARRLGVSAVTVGKALRFHGIPVRPGNSGLPPAVVRDVVALYVEGWTCGRIGDHYGLDRDAIGRYLHRSGVTVRTGIPPRPRCVYPDCRHPHAPGRDLCRRHADRLDKWGDPTPRDPGHGKGFAHANTARANTARAATAATRTVTQARLRLDAPDLPARERDVLQARVDNPGESLVELGARLGMTKDAYSSALRRALAP